nr:MAG TPA: Thioredoxin, PSI-II, reduced form, thioredoxin [Caudoviricetes sp.]
MGQKKVFEIFLRHPLKTAFQSPYVEGHAYTVLQKAEVMR